MILPLGPIHPGFKEPIRLKVQTEGEKVVNAEIEYGYVHRGIEKIMEGNVPMSIHKHLQKLLKQYQMFKHH